MPRKKMGLMFERLPQRAKENQFIEEVRLLEMILHDETSGSKAGLVEKAGELLNPEDFQDPVTRIMFETMTSFKDEGKDFDAILFNDRVVDNTPVALHHQMLEAYNLITDPHVSMSSMSLLLSHVEKLKRVTMKTKAQKITDDFAHEIKHHRGDIDNLFEAFKEKLATVSFGNVKKSRQNMEGTMTNITKALDKRLKTGVVPTKGIPTGLMQLDKLIGGFKPGEMIIIGARPGIGKTALAMNMATHAAFAKGFKVGFFSLEMSKEQLGNRVISSGTGIDGRRLNEEVISADEIEKIKRLTKRFEGNTFIVDDASDVSLSYLQAEIKKMKRYDKIDIVFIDYVSLITFDAPGMPRFEQVAAISKALKSLAKDLKIPIVVLSQVTRDKEGTAPTLASLRESGSLEQDADMVILLHRERGLKEVVFNPKGEIDTPLPVVTQLSVAKNRSGNDGVINVLFFPHLTKFVNKEIIYTENH